MRTHSSIFDALPPHTSITGILTFADVSWRILTYPDISWRILTYPDVANVAGMLTYADACWRMLTHADVCWRMLTYADVCWRMLTYAEGVGEAGALAGKLSFRGWFAPIYHPTTSRSPTAYIFVARQQPAISPTCLSSGRTPALAVS
jgi:hypothetical protein